MENESYEFRDNTHFTTGAIGKPGKRLFFIQMGDTFEYISLKIEKQQVIALARFLKNLLKDMPNETIETIEPIGLKSQTEPIWSAGQISVGVDLHNQMMVVSISDSMGNVDIPETSTLEDFEQLDSLSDSARVRVFISQAQAQDFIQKTKNLIRNSRPPCRLCGQPKNPDHHACPRLN